jgi:hypothetical protein
MMSGKIRDHFKGEAGKATARGFGASVVAMYTWPVAAAITAGFALQAALAVPAIVALYYASKGLTHRAEKKAGVPADSLSSKHVNGWLAGIFAGLVLTSFFPIFTPTGKSVTNQVPHTSVTQIAPSLHMDLNKSLTAGGLRLPTLTP